MKFIQVLSAVAFAGAFAFTSTVAMASPKPFTIRVVAQNWNFAPAEITVHVNRPVTLKLKSVSGVHGLESSALRIPLTVIAPAATKTVTFTPKKVGTYVLHCAVPCGAGHATMAFTIKVVS